MSRVYWPIQRAVGGFSDGSRSGLRDSYQYAEFIDYKSDPDLIKVLNKPTLDSGSTFQELPLWCEHASNRTFIYDKSGKLYERISANSYNLLRTVTNSSGNGLAFFNGALFYASLSSLGRYDMSATYNDSFQTLANSVFHPMQSFLNLLVIGNGNFIATLDDSNVWTAQRLRLTPEEMVRSLGIWGSYIAIGTQFGSSYSSQPRGNIYLWDGTSQFANDIIPTTGVVQALANDSGTLVAWIGSQADIYTFNGGRLKKEKKLPRFDNENVEIMPGAVGLWRNQIRFGTSGGTSTTAPKGIWTYGTTQESIPKSLSYDFALSDGSSAGADINIGFFRQLSATQALFGWGKSDTFGVDRITNESLANEATFESIIFDNNKPFLLRRPIQVRIILAQPLRSNEYVTVYIKKQGETEFTKIGRADTVGKSAFTFLCDKNIDTNLIYSSKGFQHELKIVLGGTGSTRPNYQSGTVLFEEDDDINTGEQ